MKKLLQSKKRGSAIPLAVVAVLILLAMGTGLLKLGLDSRIFSTRTTSDITARCAADAGLTMALFKMNEKLKVEPWNGSTLQQAIDEKLPYCDAKYSYRVTGNLASGFIIKSVGTADQAQRTVYAAIGLQGLFEHAILTKGQLVLKSDTIVDGYNSADPTDTEFEVDIGSQSNADGSVILNMGVVVNGDVFVANGAVLDDAIKGSGTVTGNKYTSEPEPLPTVTAPELPDKPAIDVTGDTVKITPADSGTYPEIYLRQFKEKVKGVITTIPSVLEVSGGDVVLYVTGDIQLENSCEIQIGPNASLTIYTDGNIHFRLGSSINSDNPPGKAKTLQIYATGEDKQFIDIKAKSDFTGTIYAPNDDIVLYAKGDVYGSVVANSFNYMAGGNYHYDEALREVEIDDEGVRFVVKRWHE